MSDKCGVTTKSKKACGKPAGWGTPHPGHGPCKLHGGCLPNVVKRYTPAALADLARTYGVGQPINMDPLDALIAELHRTLGVIAWLEDKIETEGEGALVGNIYSLGSGGTRVATRSATAPWVDLYRDERDRAARISEKLLALGIDERRLQLDQTRAAFVVGVISSALDSLKGQVEPDVLALMRSAIREGFLAAHELERAHG